MKPLSTLQYVYLSRFSKPACDRKLLQLIKRDRVQTILEIGLGDEQRWRNMLLVATKYCDKPIRYTGIDEFDARTGRPPLKLIQMHKAVKDFDVKCQLVPGTAGMVVQRIANSHLRTDLIVISAEIARPEIESVVSFFPRMLHANSKVMLQPAADQAYRELNRLQVGSWVERTTENAKHLRAA